MPWQQATIAWHPGRDFCIHKHFISFRKCKNQVCVCHETWRISIDAHFTCVQPQNAQGIPMNTHSHIHLLVIAEMVRTDVWFLGKLPYYCSSVCVCALKLWIKMVMLSFLSFLLYFAVIDWIWRLEGHAWINTSFSGGGRERKWKLL